MTVVAAKVMAGRTAEALRDMKEYYGAMLKLGATTFWEDFDLEWTRNAYGIDQLHQRLAGSRRRVADGHSDCKI